MIERGAGENPNMMSSLLDKSTMPISYSKILSPSMRERGEVRGRKTRCKKRDQAKEKGKSKAQIRGNARVHLHAVYTILRLPAFAVLVTSHGSRIPDPVKHRNPIRGDINNRRAGEGSSTAHVRKQTK